MWSPDATIRSWQLRSRDFTAGSATSGLFQFSCSTTQSTHDGKPIAQHNAAPLTTPAVTTCEAFATFLRTFSEARATTSAEPSEIVTFCTPCRARIIAARPSGTEGVSKTRTFNTATTTSQAQTWSTPEFKHACLTIRTLKACFAFL
jgi:hypothetical protein